MGAWLLTPPDKHYRYFQTDAAGKITFLARWASKPRDFEYTVEEIPRIHIDGGGAVAQDEPEVSWMAEGTECAAFLRHLPFVLAALELARGDDKVPGCITIEGFLHTYILGFATRNTSVVRLRSILSAQKSTIRRLEAAHAEALSPHVRFMGPCSCMSGRRFSECCGQNPA